VEFTASASQMDGLWSQLELELDESDDEADDASEDSNSLEKPTLKGWSTYSMFAYSFQLYGLRVGSVALSRNGMAHFPNFASVP